MLHRLIETYWRQPKKKRKKENHMIFINIIKVCYWGFYIACIGAMKYMYNEGMTSVGTQDGAIKDFSITILLYQGLT